MKRGHTPEPQRTRLLDAAARDDQAATDLRHAVQAAHQAGGSVREIADLINRSTNTIHRWIRET